jgi:hypothetical protein
VSAFIEDNMFLTGIGVDGCGNIHRFLEPNRDGIFDNANFNADAIIWRIIDNQRLDYLDSLNLDNLIALVTALNQEIDRTMGVRPRLIDNRLIIRLIRRRDEIVRKIAVLEREKEAEEALRAARAAGLNIELGQDVAAIRAHFAREANPDVERIAREEVARATRDGDKVQEWAIAVVAGATEREAAAPPPDDVYERLKGKNIKEMRNELQTLGNGYFERRGTRQAERTAYTRRVNELVHNESLEYFARTALTLHARFAGLRYVEDP